VSGKCVTGSAEHVCGGTRGGHWGLEKKGGDMYIGIGALILIILLVIFVF